MPTTLSRKTSITVEGNYESRELAHPKVICFQGDYDDGPESLFAQAALWLEDHPGYTLISTAFTYIFDGPPEMQLLLTVE